MGKNRLTSDQKNSFIAAWLGWTMDSFDFFLLAVAMPDIAKTFHVNAISITFLFTVTLLMRPVGAYLFGIWADKKGRRTPLMACVLCYSFFGALGAFAPTFTILLIIRLFFGIGMGGEWGLGSALAMEKMPRERRGLYSGMLQAGYASGYLLASICYLIVHNVLHLNWRWLFLLSILPAFVTLFLQLRVKESEEWITARERLEQTGTSLKTIFFTKKIVVRFLYLIVLMFAFTSLSHATQDLYPQYLKASDWQGANVSDNIAAWIPIIYNIAGIIGAISFGALADSIGKPASIVWACSFSLLILPIFAYNAPAGMLCLGASLMQFFTQGAWASVPAYLTEQSPVEIRGFYPGVTYQMGNVLSAFNNPLQQYFARQYGYPTSFTILISAAAILVVVLIVIGRRTQVTVTADGGETWAADKDPGDEKVAS